MDNQSFSAPVQRVGLQAAVPVGGHNMLAGPEKRVVDLTRPAPTVPDLRRVRVWVQAQDWPLLALPAASLRAVRRPRVVLASALTIRDPKKDR